MVKMTNSCTLPSDDPIAVELVAALEQGEIERLRQLLATNPSLACCVVESAKGGRRTALHLFAHWPGHKPNAAAIVRSLVEAGADLDAPTVGMWHRETPLHWAASNDDVALIDALLDAGASIEAAGLVNRRRVAFVLRCRLWPMGGSAAAGRAWCSDALLARSGVGVDAGDHPTGRNRSVATT